MKIVVELDDQEYEYVIRKIVHGVRGHSTCKKIRYLRDVNSIGCARYHFRRDNFHLRTKFCKAKDKRDRALRKIGKLQKEIDGIRNGVKNQ